MKKISALVMLSFLCLSPCSFAVDAASMATPGSLDNNSDGIVLADNYSANMAMRVDFTNNMTETDFIAPTEGNKSATVPIVGIVFAVFLFGAGSLVRGKKKARTNNVVGIFARSS